MASKSDWIVPRSASLFKLELAPRASLNRIIMGAIPNLCLGGKLAQVAGKLPGSIGADVDEASGFECCQRWPQGALASTDVGLKHPDGHCRSTLAGRVDYRAKDFKPRRISRTSEGNPRGAVHAGQLIIESGRPAVGFQTQRALESRRHFGRARRKGV